MSGLPSPIPFEWHPLRAHGLAWSGLALPQSLLIRSVIGLGVGALFHGQCASDAFSSVMPCNAALFIVTLVCALECVLETVLWFPLSRALLAREYANGLYSLPACFASVLATVFVQNLLGSVCLALPVYLLVGLELDASHVRAPAQSRSCTRSTRPALDLLSQ